MATMLDGTLSSEWWIEDHLDRHWHLYGGLEEGLLGVTLEDISGESVEPDLTLSATATQVGETITGTALPALAPTLIINVHERQVPGAWEAWQTALPPGRDAWLVHLTGSAALRYLRVQSRGGPTKSPGDPYQTGMTQLSIPLLGLDGCWLGEPTILTTVRTMRVGGDRPATIAAEYRSAGTVSLTVDGATWTAPLPAPGAGRVAVTDLEPAQMMKTRVSGIVTPSLWAAFRNRWNPLVLQPGSEVTASITGPGNRLVIRQRYDTPWG